MVLDSITIALARNKLKIRYLPKLFARYWRSNTNLDAFFRGTLELKYRSRYLAGASVLGLLLAFSFVWMIYLPQPDSDNSFIKFLFDGSTSPANGLLASSSVVSIIAVLISIAPSFVLWKFRDQNKLMEIRTAEMNQKTAQDNYENSRKDTNLKDFQQLQKWATGVGDSANSEALRISAIRQLGAFFQGQFGEQFQIPAYELLNALWVEQFKAIDDDGDEAINYKIVKKTADTAYAKSIVASVFGDGGKAIVQLEDKRKKLDQPSVGLMVNRDWRGIKPEPRINFTDLDLRGVNLSCAFLDYSNFSRAILYNASLIEASIESANFSNANLTGSNLTRLSARGTHFINTILIETNLSGAFILSANFLNAKLDKAELNKCYLLNISNLNCKMGYNDVKISSDTVICYFNESNNINIINTGGGGTRISIPNIIDMSIQRERTNKDRKIFGLSEMTLSEEQELIQKVLNYFERTYPQNKYTVTIE